MTATADDDARRAPVAASVAEVARRVRALPTTTPLVAVDGVDGAGKTTFADALADHLRATGTRTLRVSVDGFHRPRAERYRQGRASPSGFFEDSYDLPAFRAAVVEPLRPGGDRRVRTAVFDHRTDRPVAVEPVAVADGTAVVVDGIFLHRDELADAWDLSVWLEVPFTTTFARMAVRDGCPADPDDPANARYRDGQLLYLDRCDPRSRATLVLDHDDAPPGVRGR
nr:uridine kinase [uncultured Actinotalea sp.]